MKVIQFLAIVSMLLKIKCISGLHCERVKCRYIEEKSIGRDWIEVNEEEDDKIYEDYDYFQIDNGETTIDILEENYQSVSQKTKNHEKSVDLYDKSRNSEEKSYRSREESEFSSDESIEKQFKTKIPNQPHINQNNADNFKTRDRILQRPSIISQKSLNIPQEFTEIHQKSSKPTKSHSQGSLLIKIDPSKQISIKILSENDEKSSNFELNLGKSEEISSKENQKSKNVERNDKRSKNHHNMNFEENIHNPLENEFKPLNQSKMFVKKYENSSIHLQYTKQYPNYHQPRRSSSENFQNFNFNRNHPNFKNVHRNHERSENFERNHQSLLENERKSQNQMNFGRNRQNPLKFEVREPYQDEKFDDYNDDALKHTKERKNHQESINFYENQHKNHKYRQNQPKNIQNSPQNNENLPINVQNQSKNLQKSPQNQDQPKNPKSYPRNQNNYKNNQRSHKNPSKFCETFKSSSSLNLKDLQKMTDCHEIDFSSNNLSQLSITFASYFHVTLEVINFNNNNFKNLPENLLKSLKNLKIFSASHNQIEILNEDFFAFNIHLEFVDFSYNNLKHIPMRLFVHNTQLKFASFESNTCINHGFPVVTMEHLIGLFGVNCGDDQTVFAFIMKLIQLSEKWRVIGDDLMINGTREIESVSTNNEDDDNLDVLFTGLFWLIVPIILILGGILGMIGYVIYNKFIVYGVNARME